MTIPRPPYLPDTVEDLHGENFTKNAHTWLAYILESYECLKQTDAAVSEAQEETNQVRLKVGALEHQVQFLSEEKLELQRSFDVEINKARAELKAVIHYQEEQLQKKENLYIEAIREKDKAIALAAPIVVTPVSYGISEQRTENAADHATRTPPPATATPSESSRVSERLPDPEKFNGDRKDLRRFVSQIQEKLTVNRDRFPTPASRCSYVTSRLSGSPYAQILPYIRQGVCQLPDYEDILNILDRAFGDPNRVNNARDELFRLRQTNKDFGSFFAEFQRLALEGEMSEDALSTLLEQAISRELRNMLMHHEPPSRNYLQFANFLQDLENRRRQYGTLPAPTVRTYAQISQQQNNSKTDLQGQTFQRKEEKTATVTPVYPDPMDLSYARRSQGRKERGECFRCGATNHKVAECPKPAPARPAQLREGRVSSFSHSPVRTLSPQSRKSRRSPSPASSNRSSVKGVALI
jgi:hypothetical protein